MSSDKRKIDLSDTIIVSREHSHDEIRRYFSTLSMMKKMKIFKLIFSM